MIVKIDFDNFQNGGSLKEAMRYAIFSSAVYSKEGKERRDYLKKYGKDKHFIVPKFSNEEIMTTKHVITKEVIVAFRGSSTIEDWIITDWKLVKNMIKDTFRYKRNDKTVKALMNSAVVKKSSSLVFVGHSLGGTLAYKLGKAYNVKSLSFNRGSTPLEFVFQRKTKNHKEFLVKDFDPVSFSAKKLSKDEKEIIPKRALKANAHSIKQFLPRSKDEILMTGSNSIIEKTWKDRKEGLIGPYALWKKVKLKDPTITIRHVKEFVEKQMVYQKHKAKYPRRIFIPTFSKNFKAYQVDITFMPFTTKTSPKYILTFININSRKVYAYNGRKRTSTELITLFNKFYNDIDGKIETLTSDNEFDVPRALKKWLKDKGIIHYVVRPYDKRSLGIMNRFHRTLKSKFDKYFSLNNTINWWEATKDIVENYNNTYHRSIGDTPNNISINKQHTNLQNTIQKVEEALSQYPDYKSGMIVRFHLPKDTFEKGERVWSEDLYMVVKVSHVKTMKLMNEEGELMKGMAKYDEVQIIKDLDVKSKKSTSRIKKAREEERIRRVLEEEGIETKNIVKKTRRERDKQDKKYLKAKVRILEKDGTYEDGFVREKIGTSGQYRIKWNDAEFSDALPDEIDEFIQNYKERVGKPKRTQPKRKTKAGEYLGRYIEREYVYDDGTKKTERGKVDRYDGRNKKEYRVDFGKQKKGIRRYYRYSTGEVKQYLAKK